MSFVDFNSLKAFPPKIFSLQVGLARLTAKKNFLFDISTCLSPFNQGFHSILQVCWLHESRPRGHVTRSNIDDDTTTCTKIVLDPPFVSFPTHLHHFAVVTWNTWSTKGRWKWNVECFLNKFKTVFLHPRSFIVKKQKSACGVLWTLCCSPHNVQKIIWGQGDDHLIEIYCSLAFFLTVSSTFAVVQVSSRFPITRFVLKQTRKGRWKHPSLPLTQTFSFSTSASSHTRSLPHHQRSGGGVGCNGRGVCCGE